MTIILSGLCYLKSRVSAESSEDDDCISSPVSELLFDVATDPSETQVRLIFWHKSQFLFCFPGCIIQDLASQFPSVVSELLAMVDTWAATAISEGPPPNSSCPAGESLALSSGEVWPLMGSILRGGCLPVTYQQDPIVGPAWFPWCT